MKRCMCRDEILWKLFEAALNQFVDILLLTPVVALKVQAAIVGFRSIIYKPEKDKGGIKTQLGRMCIVSSLSCFSIKPK